jgi:hypothetical protein
MHFHGSSRGAWWDLEHFALFVGLFFCSLGLECFALFGIATPFSWRAAPPAAVVDSWRTLQTSCKIGGSNNTNDVLLLFFFSNLFDYFQRWVPCCLWKSLVYCLWNHAMFWSYIQNIFFCLHWSWPYDGWTKKKIPWSEGSLLSIMLGWVCISFLSV